MLRRLARLLFGGEEEVSEDVPSGEVVDEGWLVVPHQEATSSENQELLTADNQPAEPAPHRGRDTNVDGDSGLSAEFCPSSSTASRAVSASSSKALTELTRFACTQKTEPWPVQQHPVSRNAIQRQNRVRQGAQHASFHLQQPSQRSLGH